MQKPIEDFVVTTNKLAVFAAKWAKGGKCRAFVCHRIDLSTVTDFEEGLRSISNDIALVDGLEHHQQSIALRRELLPPSLPDMATVPAGVLALPNSYVERAAVQEVADCLTNSEEPRAPYMVVGMGGGGKTILVSAVVRKSSVREYFREGIFWMRVGRGAKNSLLPLLQGLAREMGASPTDTPHGVPHILDDLKQVQQHLGTVISTAISPRLVVLDDVWEREVAEELTKHFENVAKMMRGRGEQSSSLNTVLEASFDSLAEIKQEEILKTAVLGAGAVAPIEMLVNLWGTKVRCGVIPSLVD